MTIVPDHRAETATDSDDPEHSTAMLPDHALRVLVAALVTPGTADPSYDALLDSGVEPTGPAAIIIGCVAEIRAAGRTDITRDTVLDHLLDAAPVGRGDRLSGVTKYLRDSLTGPYYPERWPVTIATLAGAAHRDRARRMRDTLTQAIDEAPTVDLMDIARAEGVELAASHRRMMVARARIGDVPDRHITAA